MKLCPDCGEVLREKRRGSRSNLYFCDTDQEKCKVIQVYFTQGKRQPIISRVKRATVPYSSSRIER